MKCGGCSSGRFEDLPIGAILYRNHGRRSAMLAAASKALRARLRSGSEPTEPEKLRVMREAMRSFDRFANVVPL